MKLDNGTFLIVNKKYDHANLAMWGTEQREMDTYEQKVHLDQFWQLKEGPNHPGYYYIYNLNYDGYRVAKWGSGDKEVGSYNGQYFEDQLWKFEEVCGMYAKKIKINWETKIKHYFIFKCYILNHLAFNACYYNA